MARILISMPDEFLDRVDRVAGSEQRTRSEFVREALRTYIRKTNIINNSQAIKNASILEEMLK